MGVSVLTLFVCVCFGDCVAFVIAIEFCFWFMVCFGSVYWWVWLILVGFMFVNARLGNLVDWLLGYFVYGFGLLLLVGVYCFICCFTCCFTVVCVFWCLCCGLCCLALLWFYDISCFGLRLICLIMICVCVC